MENEYNLFCATNLRGETTFTSVELEAIDVIIYHEGPDSTGEPLGSISLGKVDVARRGAVVVPPGSVWTTFFIEN